MFPKVLVDDLNKIPIPILTNEFITSSISLVNNIIELKRIDVNADTTSLEAEIDQLVYQLYELSEDEIRIVEGKG